jgi:hypothetical protein
LTCGIALAPLLHEWFPLIPSFYFSQAQKFGQLRNLSAQGQEGVQNVAKILVSMIISLAGCCDLQETKKSTITFGGDTADLVGVPVSVRSILSVKEGMVDASYSNNSVNCQYFP